MRKHLTPATGNRSHQSFLPALLDGRVAMLLILSLVALSVTPSSGQDFSANLAGYVQLRAPFPLVQQPEDFVQLSTERSSAYPYSAAHFVLQLDAQRAGIELDGEFHLIVTESLEIVFAPAEGYGKLEFPVRAADGVDAGLLSLRGLPDVDDGIYVMQFVIDPAHPERASARLIDERGEPISLRLELAPDPEPEAGACHGLVVMENSAFETLEIGLFARFNAEFSSTSAPE